MEYLAQSENKQRIENIQCGLKVRVIQGTSKLIIKSAMSMIIMKMEN